MCVKIPPDVDEFSSGCNFNVARRDVLLNGEVGLYYCLAEGYSVRK